MSDQENSIPAEAEHGDPKTKEPIKPILATEFSIWPPAQRTRDAVTNRLIQTLSAPSILSKRYGTIPPDQAHAVATDIEKDAYATADASPPTDGDGDGIEILQLYSKDISKRMLDTVKARPVPPENGIETPALETAT